MDRHIEKHSPLTEASFYILLSLTQPMHGYGIIKEIEKMSNNRVKLAAGTLYGAISSLLNYKLIEMVSEEKEKRKRKTYKITINGLLLLQYEIKRLEEIIQNGKRKIGEHYG